MGRSSRAAPFSAVFGPTWGTASSAPPSSLAEIDPSSLGLMPSKIAHGGSVQSTTPSSVAAILVYHILFGPSIFGTTIYLKSSLP